MIEIWLPVRSVPPQGKTDNAGIDSVDSDKYIRIIL